MGVEAAQAIFIAPWKFGEASERVFNRRLDSRIDLIARELRTSSAVK